LGQTTKPIAHNEAYYAASFQYSVKEAGLKFVLPHGYHIVKMEDCNSGHWRCTQYLEQPFSRVFMSSDSNVVVGLKLNSNYRMIDSSNRARRGDVDWLENAQRLYSKLLDSSLKSKAIDKVLLRDFWSAEYGVEFTRKCQNPFMDGYIYNRHVLIANKDLQILMVYIYRDNFKNRIEAVISETMAQILRKI
jgi:hypothetical protein